jgi:Flp pilus assembly protein TadG
MILQHHRAFTTVSGCAMPLRRFLLRRRRDERGAALVEYAFVAILFLTLLFGISGFGHAVFVYHHLNNAAKEATRYAAVRGFTCDTTEVVASCQASNSASGISGPTTAADVTAYVSSITPPSIDATQFTITVCGVKSSSACAASIATGPQVCTAAVGTLPATPNYPGCTASVQIQYTYKMIFPLIGSTPINMSSTSEMIIAH